MPAKKTPAKKTPAKKTPAKKTPAKKTPAKKTPAKKTPAKKGKRDDRDEEKELNGVLDGAIENSEEDEDTDSGLSDDEADAGILHAVGENIKTHKFKPIGCKVETRRVISVVHPDDRVTSQIMSLAEMTEVLSQRTKHIQDGGPVYIDYGNESDPAQIAIMELKARQCPLSITRKHNESVMEVWEVNEMVLPEKL